MKSAPIALSDASTDKTRTEDSLFTEIPLGTVYNPLRPDQPLLEINQVRTFWENHGVNPLFRHFSML